MTVSEGSQESRLAILVRAAGTRWALPAFAVEEVAPLPEGDGTRGGLPVEDFGALFGLPRISRAEHPGAVTLILRDEPRRALAIEAVEEVADLLVAPFFQLPTSLSPDGLLRGAVLHKDRLALELDPRVLATLRPVSRPALAPPPGESPAPPSPPGRSLVFEAGELGWIGVPLPSVLYVIPANDPCVVPGSVEGHRGLLLHERSIVQLFDLARLAGLGETRAALAACVEVAGETVALLATRVAGVLDGFGGEGRPARAGARWSRPDGRDVLFPDLEAWIPRRTGGRAV